MVYAMLMFADVLQVLQDHFVKQEVHILLILSCHLIIFQIFVYQTIHVKTVVDVYQRALVMHVIVQVPVILEQLVLS